MIAAILLVLIHVGIDWYLIEKKNIEPEHTIEGVIFLLSVLVLVMFLQEPMFIVLAYATRFLLFDLSLNLVRGKKWNHLGTKAKTDKVLRWIENKSHRLVILGLRLKVFFTVCYFYYFL